MLGKARYIVIEGPIGASKTSLARHITSACSNARSRTTGTGTCFGPFLPGHGTLGPADTARISLSAHRPVVLLQPTDSAAGGERLPVSTRIRSSPVSTSGDDELGPCIDASSTASDHRPPVPDLVVYLPSQSRNTYRAGTQARARRRAPHQRELSRAGRRQLCPLLLRISGARCH